MKFIKLLPASFLAIPFILQLNAQIDCCGLAVGTAIKSPTVQKFVPRNQNFGSRTPALVSPPSKPSLCRTAKASRLFASGETAKLFFKDAGFQAWKSFSLPALFPMPEKDTVAAVFLAPAFPVRLPRFNRFPFSPRGLLRGKADQKHTRFLRSRHSEVGERIAQKHGFERKEQGQGRRTFGQNKKSLR